MNPAELQRESARRVANEVRLNRAQLKREIKAGDRDLAEVLKDIPKWLRSERVDRLLPYSPRIGKTRTARILRKVEIGGVRSVGNLTAREKAGIILCLQEMGRR